MPDKLQEAAARRVTPGVAPTLTKAPSSLRTTDTTYFSSIHPPAQDSDGNPIGFGIALPDINQILKRINGSLFPFGWLKLLLGLPKLTHYRMFALGVIPEYHGKAVDSLIYRALYESCFCPDVRMEINYVLEDNAPMNNAIVKLGAKPLRRYRIFEMPVV